MRAGTAIWRLLLLWGEHSMGFINTLSLTLRLEEGIYLQPVIAGKILVESLKEDIGSRILSPRVVFSSLLSRSVHEQDCIYLQRI